MSVSGSPCLTNGVINGTVTGANVTFGAVSGGDDIQFTGQLGGARLSGNYSVGRGFCAGDTGSFTVQKIN